VTLSDSMRYADNDIGELMNLWRPVKQLPMPYMHFTYNQEGKTRPGDIHWRQLLVGFTYTGITANVLLRIIIGFISGYNGK